jgi:hypothetical protein
VLSPDLTRRAPGSLALVQPVLLYKLYIPTLAKGLLGVIRMQANAYIAILPSVNISRIQRPLRLTLA